jgi:hypothetical protein
MSPGEEYEVLQQKPNSSIVINIMMLLYIEKNLLEPVLYQQPFYQPNHSCFQPVTYSRLQQHNDRFLVTIV